MAVLLPGSGRGLSMAGSVMLGNRERSEVTSSLGNHFRKYCSEPRGVPAGWKSTVTSPDPEARSCRSLTAAASSTFKSRMQVSTGPSPIFSSENLSGFLVDKQDLWVLTWLHVEQKCLGCR